MVGTEVWRVIPDYCGYRRMTLEFTLQKTSHLFTIPVTGMLKGGVQRKVPLVEWLNTVFGSFITIERHIEQRQIEKM